MKKYLIYFGLLVVLTLTISTKLINVWADERESQVTITVINGETKDSTEGKNQAQTGSTSKGSANKKIQPLPKTLDEDSSIYSTLGVFIFLVGIYGISINYKRKREVKYEKI